MRVVERGDSLGFASETRETIDVSREGIGKNLQRHITIQFRVERAVDLAHATSAEQGQYSVAAELPSDQGQGHVCDVEIAAVSLKWISTPSFVPR